ncbi:NfeD family protein [Mesorhizobium koreense]|jgi:membrane protein implicated in regulation of membrane protease activity|uniref:NfeD family protein n=1 Tax=Mesorhizobium koreense TaxID=3074855 RepID=UPI00287BA978|nr:NfeD family protein [Mesorhizobium sp. WR6]
MLTQALADLGEWNWIVLGVVLLVLEILVPGVFLLWIGIAAILTGALSLQLLWLDVWGWQIQVLVFLALSLVSAYVGTRIMGKSDGSDTDEPLLNRRAEQLVGRTATLEEAIVNGRGRIRLGDTLWRVSGPDLPAGTRVRVTTVKNTGLIVEAA